MRKNLTLEEWEYIIREKRKRDELGKDSQISLNGNVISMKKFKKEEARKTWSELNRIYSTCRFLSSKRLQVSINKVCRSKRTISRRGSCIHTTVSHPRRHYQRTKDGEPQAKRRIAVVRFYNPIPGQDRVYRYTYSIS